ncbi:patatin-like phospholipase family protein [Williamwhitmania taraxaci]|uniref:Patatin-like phospholipase n=1 Tax=Williamwhitmania taraxaci TaxID=1640674 RepID=A0A1G6GTV2_9BACT|nr:patatin-like phospholipase family protein [Williamwhitmania taraxaci]SDB85343.1 Patatin-like phospholipase [Williamwhitmania taraxaci]
MSNQNTFRIGISMAGAISAGAYTAGVMDYLFEALESWQKAKDLGLPDVPKHSVIIEILSGASAGGMTAVITCAGIQRNFPHINHQNYATAASTQNPMFDSWVNLTEQPSSDMMSQMLSSDDILSTASNPDKEVRSIFNSLFIEKIARRTIDSLIADPSIQRKYIADDLELFTTITNLRGFNYQLQFITAEGKREDRMTMHKDIVHFQLNPTGTYRNDGKIPFNFSTPDGVNRNLLIDAAIATGAFPVGLAPRVLTRDPKYINDNPLLKISHTKNALVDPLTDYTTVCVDGGVINNEPYDTTETILFNRRKAEIAQELGSAAAADYKMAISAANFDTTVLTIDPFPNYEDKPIGNYFDLVALKFAAPDLVGAMRQQLMLKTDLLEKAYSEDDYSRFMIAPIRTKGGITQKYSIACGSLGGFGGFFNKQFRVHDYMLGRRNCQRFIQQFFSVPVSANNPIIRFGYEGINADIIQGRTSNDRPIIPDIRISDDNTHIILPMEEKEFDYPAISLKYLMSLEPLVQKRFGIVLDNIANGKNPGTQTSAENPIVKRIRKHSWFGRNISGPIGTFTAEKFIAMGKTAGKGIAAEKFIDAVITDMDKRGLLNQDC